MTTAVTSMKSKLAPLCFYDLTPGSLISAELEAYGVAFSLLYSLMDKIVKDSHIQTAEADAIKKHEELVGISSRGDIADKTRRELVIYRTSIAPYDFTAEKMLSSVRAAGIDAVITEDYENEKLIIDSLSLIDPTLTPQISDLRLQNLLPAHLAWELDFGFTDWLDLAALDYSWDNLDLIDADWDNADITIQEILQQQK